ncbi:CDP-glycerol glycerophosphotransferase family protein [Candidatus Saccharibacteria bacterium]|nr:CDP-glycerol glycerophosphotransferase family protein [Candidatus Saccharibacteria bacterium]
MKNEIKNKKIAFYIKSEVQFFSLEPLLKELKRKGYNFKILIPSYEWEKDYKAMTEKIKELVNGGGYKTGIVNGILKEKFDLYITAYRGPEVDAKCYLKYEYGTLNVKPISTDKPEVMAGFHGFLCQSTVTADYFAAYGRTFLVDNLKFLDKKRTKNRGSKKKVLFAPTYNDAGDATDLVEIVKNLKRKYYVIIKGHHGTTYRSDKKAQKDVLMDMADEYYGPEKNIADVMMGVDVCLTGNSSVIGEALYAEVPCAVFAYDLDEFCLPGMHTTQYKMVRDGMLPYTGDVKKIEKIIEAALTREYKKKQRKLGREILPLDRRNGVEGYLEVIDYFLDYENVEDYVGLHNYKNKIMQEEKEELDKYKVMVDSYKNRKLYKLAGKVYKMMGRP